MRNYQLKFLMECGVINTECHTNNIAYGFGIESPLFVPSKFHTRVGTYDKVLFSVVDDLRDMCITSILRELKNGTIQFAPDADAQYQRALQEHNAKEFETPDGAIGIIRDVTKEDWYQNPDIELYDAVEADTFALACKCAELAGVTMEEENIDFYIAKHISEATIKILSDVLGVKFPGYEDSEETSE